MYRFTFNEFIELFYNEFKKYCNLNNNINYCFYLGFDYTEYFGQTLSDTGNNIQKNNIEKCIEEFKYLITDIDKIIVVKKNSIDPRELLFETHEALKTKFEALLNIKMKKGNII